MCTSRYDVVDVVAGEPFKHLCFLNFIWLSQSSQCFLWRQNIMYCFQLRMAVVPVPHGCVTYSAAVFALHSNRHPDTQPACFFHHICRFENRGIWILVPIYCHEYAVLRTLTVEAKVSGPVANLSCRVWRYQLQPEVENAYFASLPCIAAYWRKWYNENRTNRILSFAVKPAAIITKQRWTTSPASKEERRSGCGKRCRVQCFSILFAVCSTAVQGWWQNVGWY